MIGRMLGVAALAAYGVVAMPTPAQAAGATNVFLNGSTMTAVAAAGTENTLTVRAGFFPSGGSAYAVTEHAPGGSVTAGSPCQVVSSSTAMCPRSSVNGYLVNANDLDDVIQVDADLNGAVHAGPGDDFVFPGPAQDDVFGDSGSDGVSYRTRTTPVSMSLDFAENDGAPLERDFLASDLELLEGGTRGDTLIGNGQVQRLHGNGGNDILDGGLGPDQLFGGTGTDTVDYSQRINPVTVSVDSVAGDGEAGEDDWVPVENEIVIGGSADDTLSGPLGDNVFVGGPGRDLLRGDAGSDTLDGGTGPDTLSGGAGFDTASYRARTAPVVVTINSLANDGEAGEKDKVGTDVEEVDGGSGDDRITGNGAPNVLVGFDGNDQLTGAGSDDILDGGAGADTLAGAGGRDHLTGGDGPDSFAGGGDLDEASFADRFTPVSVSIDGVANDGSPGEGDNVKGDVETLRGGADNDTLQGSGDAETLLGGAGNDTLLGLGGVDVLIGDAGADVLSGGAGTDTASWAIYQTPVVVSIDGVANDGAPGEGDRVDSDVETLVGGAASDVLTGGAGRNTLFGGPGNDVLDGGLGPDQLYGGAGLDAVTYSARTVPIVVRLDNNDNDGQSGERDRIRTDVEEVRGGSAGDRLTGSARDDRLYGGSGDDFLWGLAGADVLDGQLGVDTLDGGDGNDFCTGETLTGCP